MFKEESSRIKTGNYLSNQFNNQQCKHYWEQITRILAKARS
ncbi:MAG: hypothetical protein ACFFD4_34425 [Candidatus Odinarchaeota archaeon]